MSTVLCTLGMHRSGTSVVSRLLNLLGVALGPDSSVAERGDDNPTGYWEHSGLKRINDDLLARFGGTWDRPTMFPEGWMADPAVRTLADEARGLVREEFDGLPTWGWKDPRTCLTLPFWQDVIGPMRYVICVRDPREVVASLAHRDGMPGVDADVLWLTHLDRALRHTRGLPRIFVSYDAVLADPAGQCRRLAQFAGLQVPASLDDPSLQQWTRGFLDPTLRHHRSLADELACDGQASFASRTLFLHLRDAAADRPLSPDVDLGDVAAAACASAAAHARDSAEADAARRQTALLTTANEELQAGLTRLESKCHEVERQNEALHRTIATMESGSAWQLIEAGRRVTASVLPPGSQRRTRLAALVGRIARLVPASSRQTGSPAVASPAVPSIGFCTLAIHAPYRARARRLIADAPSLPWVVVTDEPADFADLHVQAIAHEPTGPMAVDYLGGPTPARRNRGASAYHDKRFAVRATLERFDTAVFLDADSRLSGVPALGPMPPGLCALPLATSSIEGHLEVFGSDRRPAFEALARACTGRDDALTVATWCHEACYAVTKDGNEARFFDTWAEAASLLQAQGVHSGEGGVMGLAALAAGWRVNYTALDALAACVTHEGGGPKEA